MKKPARKTEPAPRLLKPSDLERIRGGGSDDWETPIALRSSAREWNDDWLAPK